MKRIVVVTLVLVGFYGLRRLSTSESQVDGSIGISGRGTENMELSPPPTSDQIAPSQVQRQLDTQQIANREIPSSKEEVQTSDSGRAEGEASNSESDLESNDPDQKVADEVQDEVNEVEQLWFDHRTTFLDQIGLEDNQLQEMEKLRLEHIDRFHGLMEEFDRTLSKADQERLQDEIASENEKFERGILEVIGAQNFEALQKERDQFNRTITKEGYRALISNDW